jgi:peptide/nickel transport system substrate-binding protein
MAGSRKSVRLAALVVSAMLGLAGCSGSAHAGASDKTLVIGIESEPDILDPQGAGGWVTHRINSQMFESLVTEDLKTPAAEAEVPALVPGLAESWSVSPDGLVYTFNLRKGVEFTDGTVFDAAAVDYNIRRMWDTEAPQYDIRAAGQTVFLWQHLADIQIMDPLTVQLILSEPFSPFLRVMAQGGSGSTGMISPTALETYGDDIADHPVGTGPFVFEERIRGQRVSLVRNDNYWGKKAELDRVVFRPIPDAAARIASIRNKETDIIAVPSPDSVANLRDAGFQVVEAAPPHSWYLTPNMNEEPMKDHRVRRAISLAIDREGLAEYILRDTATPAASVQAPANPGYEEHPENFRHDPELARELLAEAGYADGFTTTLETSVDGSGQIMPVPMAQYIQQNLAEVGITVNLKTYEWISYISHYNSGLKQGVGMAQMSWGMSTPFWLYITTSSDLASPAGPNAGRYSNAVLDAAMDNAIGASNEDEANKYWLEANAVASEDLALIPIVNDKSPYIVSPQVEGFALANEEWYDLTEVSLNHD